MGVVEILVGNFSGNFEQLVDRASHNETQAKAIAVSIVLVNFNMTCKAYITNK